MILKALLLVALSVTMFAAPDEADIQMPFPSCLDCELNKLPDPPPAPGLPPCYPNCSL